MLAVLAWSLAVPLVSTPDAAQHVAYAASVVRGNLTSPEVVVEEGASVSVKSRLTVPQAYAELDGRFACFDRANPDRIGCDLVLGDGRDATEALSSAGRYPPAYYFLVGLPTLIPKAAVGIQFARWVAVAMNGLLLAAAIVLARRWKRDVVLLLAFTPRLGFLSALVNPSGPELAGSVLLWVGALRVAERLRDADASGAGSGAWAALGVGGAVVALARPIGPVMVASVIGAAALYALASRGPRAVAQTLGRTVADSVVARRAMVGLGVAMLVAVSWILWRDPSGALSGVPAPDLAVADIVRQMLEDLHGHLRAMVWFGSLATADAWLLVVGVAVGAALWRGDRGARLAVGAVVAWALVVPILAVIRTADQIGVVWQGRYSQPVVAGLVVIASFTLGARLAPAVADRVRVAVAAGVGVVNVWAVQEHLASRIAWPGAPTSWFPAAAPDGWSPLLPALAVVLVAAVGWVLLVPLPVRGVRPRTPAMLR